MSTENEEIMGVLLGEVVPLDDSYYTEHQALIGSKDNSLIRAESCAAVDQKSYNGVRNKSHIGHRHLQYQHCPISSLKLFGNSDFGEEYGNTKKEGEHDNTISRKPKSKASHKTIARIWGARAIPRVDNARKNDRVEIAPEMLCLASDEADKMTVECGRHTRVIGWYHSHPHITCYPSSVDLRSQLTYQSMESGWVGLIFSVFPDKNTPEAAVGNKDINSSGCSATASMSMHCFQTYSPGTAPSTSFDAYDGVGNGHKKVPVYTIPLTKMPLSPATGDIHSALMKANDTTVSGQEKNQDVTLTNTSSIPPDYHIESYKILSVLHDEATHALGILSSLSPPTSALSIGAKEVHRTRNGHIQQQQCRALAYAATATHQYKLDTLLTSPLIAQVDTDEIISLQNEIMRCEKMLTLLTPDLK